jgi:hypothetical protein
MVIVVVYLRDELIGVNAWKANETRPGATGRTNDEEERASRSSR